MDTRRFGIFYRVISGIYIFRDSPRQAAYGGSLHLFGDALDSLKIPGTGYRESRFDDIDAKHCKLSGYLYLLIDIKARARALLPVP